jgi:hypothetical protein
MFEQILKDLYARCTPCERVAIAFSMFDTERAIVEASLPIGLDQRERHRQICERFYGKDFADKVYPR